MADMKSLHFISGLRVLQLCKTENGGKQSHVTSTGQPHLDWELYPIADNGSPYNSLQFLSYY